MLSTATAHPSGAERVLNTDADGASPLRVECESGTPYAVSAGASAGRGSTANEGVQSVAHYDRAPAQTTRPVGRSGDAVNVTVTF
jgi:spore coat protein U-like protein